MITPIVDGIAIGNSEDARRIENPTFDATVNVAIDLDIEDQFKWRHKVGLLDGPGNNPITFIAAVMLLYSLVQQRRRILVHCHEGKSRSVMVVATYVAMMGYMDLDSALGKIMPVRKVDRYRPALYDMASKSLPLLKELVTRQYAV